MIRTEMQVGKSKDGRSPTPVVVMGCEGEPVMMEAVNIGPQFVTVRRPGGTETTVRFPYDIVFAFDVSRFHELVKAFTSGDRETLDRLWRYTPTIG